jgi:hypothetical protein
MTTEELQNTTGLAIAVRCNQIKRSVSNFVTALIQSALSQKTFSFLFCTLHFDNTTDRNNKVQLI